MKMYLITGLDAVRGTLEEAKEHLATRYSTYLGPADLQFEADGNGSYRAYNFSAKVSWEEQAPLLDERIVLIEVPVQPSRLPHELTNEDSAVLEMHITTKDGRTSFKSVETWVGTSDHLRGYMIEMFAARAARALADHQQPKGDL